MLIVYTCALHGYLGFFVLIQTLLLESEKKKQNKTRLIRKVHPMQLHPVTKISKKEGQHPLVLLSLPSALAWPAWPRSFLKREQKKTNSPAI